MRGHSTTVVAPTPYRFRMAKVSTGCRGRLVARGSGDEIEIVTYSRVPFVNPPTESAITSSPPLCLDSFLLLFRPVTLFWATVTERNGQRERERTRKRWSKIAKRPCTRYCRLWYFHWDLTRILFSCCNYNFNDSGM